MNLSQAFGRRLLLAALVPLISACGSTVETRWSGPQPTALPTVTPLPAAVSAILTANAPSDSNAAQAQATQADATTRPIGAGATAIAVPDTDLLQRAIAMDAHLKLLAARGEFNGAVLAAAGTQVLIADGYGTANRDLNQRATAVTRFRLASVTKPFTATAIWQLQAAGKLDVSASVCAYLTACPAAWQPITLLHLLAHRAGLPNYTDFQNFPELEQQQTSPETVIARFRDLPLVFSPGAAYQYTNSAYVVLGRVIEAVSGQTYADYVTDNIFIPAGMQNSGFDAGDGAALNGTLGYLNSSNQRAIPINTSNLDSAGAIYSTVEDLYRFVQALRNDVLLPGATREAMLTPVANDVAAGWMVATANGRRVMYHPGFISGAVTHLAWYPDDGSTMIVLSNQENVNSDGIATYLETFLP